MDATGLQNFSNTYEVEVEFRGETLHYIEPRRRTSMMWMWTSVYTVYPDTMQDWQNADGSTTPLSEDDRREVLRRVMDYAAKVQGVNMEVE